MPNIEGKVALVTGGASGIGKAVSRRLLEKGAKLVGILDINETAGQQVFSEFAEEFGKERVRFEKCDVSNESEIKAAFQEVHSVHQTLNIILNNAGSALLDPIETIEVNLIAVIRGIQIAADLMKQTHTEEKPVVINTSSVAGLNGGSEITPVGYVASKAGMIGLTRSFGKSLDDFGKNLRIATICPDLVTTPMNLTTEKLREMKLPEDIIKKISSVVASMTPVPMPVVVEAFIQVIEDDKIPTGTVFSVTAEKGTQIV